MPTAAAPQPPEPSGSRGHGATGPRVLASEWIKLRSLRSTLSAALATALAIVGGAAFTAVGILVKDAPPAAELIAADPSGGALSGTGLAKLAVLALGVLSVTAEYRAKTIRSSIAAVPTRHPLVWAKAGVVAAGTAAVSLGSLLLAFLVARAVVAVEGLTLSLTTPGVPRAMIGAALALGVTGALAVGAGWLLRNTAAAVFALLAVFYVVPSLVAVLPFAERLMPLLPSNAVAGLTSVAPVPGALPPWLGLAVYAGYAVLTLTAAAVVVRRRDA